MAGRLQRRVSKAGQEDGEQEQPRNDSTLAKSVFQGIYLEERCIGQFSAPPSRQLLSQRGQLQVWGRDFTVAWLLLLVGTVLQGLIF